jgi:hypothetical protein
MACMGKVADIPANEQFTGAEMVCINCNKFFLRIVD